MDVVKAICNHVAVIDHGKLVAKGTLEDILQQKNHPVVSQFLSKENNTLPSYLSTKIYADKENSESGNPIYAVDLEGNFSLANVLTELSNGNESLIRILKTDVEFMGTSNIGTVIIELTGNQEQMQHAEYYLQHNSIKHQRLGYA